jgi:hypothetical protein
MTDKTKRKAEDHRDDIELLPLDKKRLEIVEEVLTECRKKADQGTNKNDVIAYMHSRGLDILESIRGVAGLYRVSLGDSKQLVSAHPVWEKIVKGADQMHEELEEALRKEGWK